MKHFIFVILLFLLQIILSNKSTNGLFAYEECSTVYSNIIKIDTLLKKNLDLIFDRSDGPVDSTTKWECKRLLDSLSKNERGSLFLNSRFKQDADTIREYYKKKLNIIRNETKFPRQKDRSKEFRRLQKQNRSFDKKLRKFLKDEGFVYDSTYYIRGTDGYTVISPYYSERYPSPGYSYKSYKKRLNYKNFSEDEMSIEVIYNGKLIPYKSDGKVVDGADLIDRAFYSSRMIFTYYLNGKGISEN